MVQIRCYDCAGTGAITWGQMLDSLSEQVGLETKFESWARFGIGGYIAEENSRQEEELEGIEVRNDRECFGNSY